MAVIPFTVVNPPGLGGRRVIRWLNLTNNDIGQPFDIEENTPLSITIEASIPESTAQIIRIYGSNKDTVPTNGAHIASISPWGHYAPTRKICRWYWPVSDPSLGSEFASVYMLIDDGN